MSLTINKKVLGLTIAFLLTISAACGGVLAYFSDVETSSNNILICGTLNLVPTVIGTGPSGKYIVTTGSDGNGGRVVFQKLCPGDSGNITWALTNDGSLPGTLTTNSTLTFAENGVPTEIEIAPPGTNNGGGNGDLDEYVGVTLQRGAGADQTAAEAAFSYLLGDGTNYVPLGGLKAALDDAVGQTISAKDGSTDTIVYKLSWNILTDIMGAGPDGKFGTGDDVQVNDNIVQTDTANIDISFTLNQ